jgi:plasmid stability protein
MARGHQAEDALVGRVIDGAECVGGGLHLASHGLALVRDARVAADRAAASVRLGREQTLTHDVRLIGSNSFAIIYASKKVVQVGQLLVRDLDDEIIKRLKRRAAANGRSAEAEHRAILEAAMRLPIGSVVETARRFRLETADRSGDIDSTEMIREQREVRASRS